MTTSLTATTSTTDDLIAAIEKGSIASIKTILNSGIDVNARFGEEYAKMSPILFACYFGNLEVVKCLLDMGADPFVFDGEGTNPLHRAVCSKNLKLVQFIYDLVGGVGMTDIFGETALNCAISQSTDEIVRFLKSKGASIPVWK